MIHELHRYEIGCDTCCQVKAIVETWRENLVTSALPEGWRYTRNFGTDYGLGRIASLQCPACAWHEDQ